MKRRTESSKVLEKAIFVGKDVNRTRNYCLINVRGSVEILLLQVY